MPISLRSSFIAFAFRMLLVVTASLVAAGL